MGDYRPNEQQQAVLDDVARGEGNTIVSARAGTGKTSAILASLAFIPERERRETVLVAFNADIAKVLKAKAPAGVDVKTMHALGLRACGKAFGQVAVDKFRGRRIAEEVSGADKDARKREWATSLHRVVARCKSVMAVTAEQVDGVIDALSPDHPEDPVELLRCQEPSCRRWSPVLSDEVCGHAGCRGKLVREVKDDRPEFIRQVLRCLERAQYDLEPSDVGGEPERRHPREVDFDDMCFLPVAMNLKMPKYVRVFADEVQDLSTVQHRLVVGSLARGGRFCGIGDDRQQIYQFRGVSEGVMRELRDELGAKELPMTTTYRCGKAIVREAQKLVPDFRAGPDQHEGSVEDATVQRMRREVAPGDFILSRVNAPLMGLCLSFLREGRRATIKGRSVGAKLQALVRRSKAETVQDLVEWIGKWCARECEKLAAKGESTEGVLDVRACLLAVAEGARDAADVQGKLARLFDDEDDATCITLSTVHRAKGLERDRVWLLRDTFWPERSQAEQNLLYVAITRAIHTLFLVRGRVDA